MVCLHGLDMLAFLCELIKLLSLWMLFSLLCVSVSASQHSHVAKDVEVSLTKCMDDPRSCSAGVDETSVFLNSVSVRFGLHANKVEEYILLSALLHDQCCLQSSPSFQHQFVWLPFFLEPWFARVSLFMYM